jgi:fluoride exporter
MSDDAGTKTAVAAAPYADSSRRRRDLIRQPWDVLAVIAGGGAIGSLARYGIGVAWPTPVGAFPGATLTINVLGCAVIGVLMVLITEIWVAHRLVRPFLGTGVLGGFTTFSTYAVDTERLVRVGAARTGLLYLVATPAAALAAVWIATVITRHVARRGINAAGR